eukprot:12403382-Karenia_brevis.AAC.1
MIHDVDVWIPSTFSSYVATHCGDQDGLPSMHTGTYFYDVDKDPVLIDHIMLSCNIHVAHTSCRT